MKHTNLREEILASMEYSKAYRRKQSKVDTITCVLFIVLGVLLLAIVTL